MKKIILLTMTALLAMACAHGDRDPASVKQEKEARHEQFQHGVFDRPNQY
jgi:hypothetical protein